MFFCEVRSYLLSVYSVYEKGNTHLRNREIKRDREISRFNLHLKIWFFGARIFIFEK